MVKTLTDQSRSKDKIQHPITRPTDKIVPYFLNVAFVVVNVRYIVAFKIFPHTARNLLTKAKF